MLRQTGCFGSCSAELLAVQPHTCDAYTLGVFQGERCGVLRHTQSPQTSYCSLLKAAASTHAHHDCEVGFNAVAYHAEREGMCVELYSKWKCPDDPDIS